MYNLNSKNEIVKQFVKNVDTNLDLVKRYGNLAECMENDNVDMAKYLIDETIKAMVSSVPDEISIPEVSVYTSMSGDGSMIRTIDLILRNKYSSNYKFKIKKKLVYSKEIFEVVADFLKCSYIELIVDTLVRQNLNVVNAKLAEIGKEAGNDFKVTIVSPLSNEGKKIISITDNEVVFVADEERALDLDDILVFCQPTEFLTEDKIKEGFDMEVAKFAQAQTTPQFVGVHDPLVGYICDISRLVKPFTLIKKVYSRNIDRLNSNKETLAYYLKDGIYSVISSNEDGKEVVLKPFNTDTLEVVEVDVFA